MLVVSSVPQGHAQQQEGQQHEGDVKVHQRPRRVVRVLLVQR